VDDRVLDSAGLAVNGPKFTPGPWRIDEFADYPRGEVGPVWRLSIVTASSDRNATGEPALAHVGRGPAAHANARLIAAAPELYEAIAAAAEFLRSGTPIHAGSDVANDLLAALAKVQP
jgi:hypothetical protein